MEKSYYEVLGVPQNADSLTIKKAYKSLVKKYHPDIYKGEDRDERFKEIQKAYDVLSDESKRAQYDNVGHTSYSNQEKYSNGYSYRDVNGFNDFKGYANVKFKSFSDLNWYTKILIIIAIILGFFLLLIVGLIFLIIYLIKFIIALFTGASRSE